MERAYFKRFVFISLMLSIGLSSHTHAQIVEKGTADLRNWDPEEEKTIELNGDWDFYLLKFVDPLQHDYKNSMFPQTLRTPNRMVNLFQESKRIPAIGYGTYRLKIVLNPKFVDGKTRYSFFIPSIISSYRMWIDTTLVLEKGCPAQEESRNTPYIEPGLATFIPSSDTTVVTIHFQNKLFPSTFGIVKPVSFGLEENIKHKEKTREYFYLICSIFCYSMAFFFILLMFMGEEKKVSLLAIAFCITLGMRYMVDGAYLITYIFPGLNPEIMIKLSLMGIISFGFITAIGYHYFPEEINKKIARPVFSVYIFYTLWLLFIPSRISGYLTPYLLMFSVLLMGFLAVRMFPAYKKKKEASGFFLLLLIFTVIIVPLNYFVLKEYVPVAGIAHVLLFTALVIKKLSFAQNRVIQLSKDLQLINKNLENIVQERTSELNIANESLRKLNLAKDRFISILSHDLRNPLNNLIGLSKRLVNKAQNNDTEQVVDYGKMINESAVKCHSLAENLLDWSLIQLGDKGIKHTSIRLKDKVDDVIGFLESETVLKNITMVSHIDKDCRIYADERMVETVLRNLITNAIKFSYHNSKIEIDGEKDGLFYTIHIKDNGTGISNDSLENLFRIDKKVYSFGTDDEPGSGFGLILSKEFIESNRGSIVIKSEEGQGTEVSFSLPVFDMDKISG